MVTRQGHSGKSLDAFVRKIKGYCKMSEVSKSKKISLGIVGTLLVGAIGFGLWSWYAGRNISKVNKLVERLAVAGDLPKVERNALKLELMRTVDELPGEQLQELYRQLGEKNADQEKEKISQFASASDAEKAVMLDADLERRKNRGDVWRALRSDGMPYSSWRGKGRRRNKDDGGKKEKKKMSDEEKAARKEYYQQRGEYYKALKERAAELGMGGDDRRKKDGRGK